MTLGGWHMWVTQNCLSALCPLGVASVSSRVSSPHPDSSLPGISPCQQSWQVGRNLGCGKHGQPTLGGTGEPPEADLPQHSTSPQQSGITWRALSRQPLPGVGWTLLPHFQPVPLPASIPHGSWSSQIPEGSLQSKARLASWFLIAGNFGQFPGADTLTLCPELLCSPQT